MRVWTFGDSWAAGWGLKRYQKNLGDFISARLGCKHKQKGHAGSSLGQIVYDLQKNSVHFKQKDLVVVIIPPDVRWYTEKEKSIQSIYKGMQEYNRFIKGKSTFWFYYHHSLFLYTIYCLCRDYECNLIMAHNYGELVINKEFNFLIPNHVFLDKEKSLTRLLQTEDWSNNYNLEYDGPPKPFIGKHFIENDTHPNELGHKKIADMIIEKYNAIYK